MQAPRRGTPHPAPHGALPPDPAALLRERPDRQALILPGGPADEGLVERMLQLQQLRELRADRGDRPRDGLSDAERVELQRTLRPADDQPQAPRRLPASFGGTAEGGTG